MNTNRYAPTSVEQRIRKSILKLRWESIHLDPLLFFLILCLAGLGLMILYSASNASTHVVSHQVIHFLIATTCLIGVAQINPNRLKIITPYLYLLSLCLILLVPFIGHSSQGAKRWIGFHAFYIQPSEIMKLAMPMMLAWLMDEYHCPPSGKLLLTCFIVLLLPVAFIAKQPDLGTAIVIFISGLFVIILAGLNWKYFVGMIALAVATSPVAWHFMHAYQKNRILTLLNPQNDPLGTGYNIIQSEITVGSGGFWGKGWLRGTQTHLAFLPTHTTDFIFAVSAEEFGLFGCLLLILLLLTILWRCCVISIGAQTSFSRLLCAALSFTFISSALINIGMVIGILPVVGIPLSLISYGGTHMVTTCISFGMMMSVHTNKKLWSS